MDDGVTTKDEARTDVLKRLAEQAMTDPSFRAAARENLDAALAAYGYDLNDRERTLVTQFRATLADAGIDLDLNEPVTEDQIAALLGR